MKKLTFERLSILSKNSQTAFQTRFHPRLTVITGANDTGKSSLTKMLYWSLGADPVVIHPIWRRLDVTTLMEFLVDGQKYFCLRFGRMIAVFNENGSLLIRTSKITEEFAPFMADLLGFGLRLADSSAQSRVPPPAFCFLPYYIDQDRGWLEAWKSFGNLGQFPSHRSDVILYHSGIRSNAYYEAKARIAALSAELETVSANRAAVEQAYERIRRRTKSPSVGADPRAYQAVIQRILGDIARAQAQREVVTAKISDLTRRRIELHEQMEVVKRSLMEFDKDFKFLQEIEDEEIICPTCGTAHENSFSNRFSIAKDHESCRMLLISASAEMDDMRKKIDDHTQSLSKFNSNISSLHNALQERRGRLTVKEFIDSEGEKRALQLLWSEVSELNKAVARLDAELAELRRSLAKLSDPKIRRKIESYFAGEIAMNLNMLNVSTVPPSIASRIDSVIRDTGSDQPRALLAYYIAFIYTSLNFSSSCICPVVIDSPNQQDQDPANFNKIYEVIMDKIPDKVQTIIATVSLPMPAGEASVINMEKNIHCLISMPMPASVMI